MNERDLRRRAHHQGVAVGGHAEHLGSAEHHAAADVFDDHRLAPRACKLVGHDPGERIGGRAAGCRYDKFDRARGEGRRRCILGVALRGSESETDKEEAQYHAPRYSHSASPTRDQPHSL